VEYIAVELLHVASDEAPEHAKAELVTVELFEDLSGEDLMASFDREMAMVEKLVEGQS
jgi:hypothetical protein